MPSFKQSGPRSEMRSVRDNKGHNYIVFRFKDDGNNNCEYHVYTEVVAKKAARDIANHLGVDLVENEGTNVRQLWDQIWDQKLTL